MVCPVNKKPTSVSSSIFSKPCPSSTQASFFSEVKYKQEKKLQKIITLCKKTNCCAFQIGNLPSDASSEVKKLNGKLFIIPNEAFIKGLLSETNNKIGLGLVSLKDVQDAKGVYGWLPFDLDHEKYIPKWKDNLWLRVWHLWLSINNTIFNNSLARIQTFNYPDHMHVSSWNSRKIERDYGWMNLIIEPILFLPKKYTAVLLKVMKTLEVISYKRVVNDVLENDKRIKEITDLQKNLNGATDKNTIEEINVKIDKLITDLFNAHKDKLCKLLAFSKAEYRLDTFKHLIKSSDRILELRGVLQSIHSNYSLPLQAFRVRGEVENTNNLERANCLNLAFVLGNPKFIEAIASVFGEHDAEIIKNIAEYLQLFDLDYSGYQKKYDTVYTSAQLLNQAFQSCPITLLNGSHPAQKGNQLDYKLPLTELGVNKEIADTINDVNLRIPLSGYANPATNTNSAVSPKLDEIT